jgi:SET domain-containing protein
LFAKEKVPSACDLGISSVEDSRVPEGEIRTPLGGFINHSFKPNCDIVQKRGVYRLVTLREIKKDEELTVDYSPWYDKAMLKTYN